jgi:hypothetical protein
MTLTICELYLLIGLQRSSVELKRIDTAYLHNVVGALAIADLCMIARDVLVGIRQNQIVVCRATEGPPLFIKAFTERFCRGSIVVTFYLKDQGHTSLRATVQFAAGNARSWSFRVT